jgi:hypothetical protein
MAQQTINIGASPNDGTGTPLRTAFQYTNSNFSELYTAVGPSGNNIVVPGNATITGDLTVATDALKVNSSTKDICIGTTTPTFNNKLTVVGGAGGDAFITSGNGTRTGYIGTDGTNVIMGAYSNHPLRIHVNDYPQMEVAALGVFNWYDGAGGTRMTLNATGLGVGRSPSYRLQASSGTKATTASLATVVGITTTDADDFGIYFRLKTDSTGANRFAAITAFDNGSGNGARDLVLQDLGGNVGIGVTPSAWGSGYTALQNRQTSWFSTSARDLNLGANVYVDAVGYKYIATAAASSYVQYQGAHSWYSATSGTAGTAITDFATAKMTLDASGNLIVNGTTQFAKISSYVTNSGTFQSALGATNGSNSDFLVRIKTSVSDIYNSVGNLTLSTGGGGGTERVRVKNTGQLRFVPLAADPSGAEAGDVYYNSTDNKLKCYNGTTWNDLF